MKEVKWCCVSERSGKPVYDFSTMANTEAHSRKKFMQGMDNFTWKAAKEKWGWDCVKVLVTIQKIG